MKQILYLFIAFLILGLTGCEKQSPQEAMKDTAPGDLKSIVIELPVPDDLLCGLPVKLQSYWTDDASYVNTGSVLLGVDKDNLYITVKAGFGFQPVADNIDIGFFKSMPATTPDPSSLNYHFTATDYLFQITIPLDEIMLEDWTKKVGIKCGEKYFIVIHTDVYKTLGAEPVSSWVGKKPSDKYFYFIPECCLECNDETAWSNGMRYVDSNWATYTMYDGTEMAVALFAGQNMLAGTVYFFPGAETVNIRIELEEGWNLADDDEAVKIQGYDYDPSGYNPSPGLFTTYKGTSLDVNVPTFNFFGIHLDLIYCE